MQHIFTRRGPFLKDWTTDQTTYLLFGIPLATKIKLPDLQQIRLLGVPLRSIRCDDAWITVSILGIRVQKRENLEAMTQRLSSRISEVARKIAPYEQTQAEKEATRFLMQQLSVLDQLISMRGERA